MTQRVAALLRFGWQPSDGIGGRLRRFTHPALRFRRILAPHLHDAITDSKVYRFHRSVLQAFSDSVFFEKFPVNVSLYSLSRLLQRPRSSVYMRVLIGWRIPADDEAKTTQVPELQGVVPPRPAKPAALAVPLGQPLPQGEQGGEPDALAAQIPESDLPPGSEKRLRP